MKISDIALYYYVFVESFKYERLFIQIYYRNIVINRLCFIRKSFISQHTESHKLMVNLLVLQTFSHKSTVNSLTVVKIEEKKCKSIR